MPTDANGYTASRVERTNGFYSYKMETRIDAGEKFYALLRVVGRQERWSAPRVGIPDLQVFGLSVACEAAIFRWSEHAPQRLELATWEPGSFGNPNACQTRLRV